MSSAISKLKKILRERPQDAAETVIEEPVDLEIVFESSPQSLSCPITRQPFLPRDIVFQCWNCNLLISLAGHEFLKLHEKARCCGCGGVDTLKRTRLPE